MCQSIQSIYQFCGCRGELLPQICTKPSTECGILLANPSDLLFSCYCERHSSQTFKTIRQDQRDTARVQKEYGKIIAKEESDWKTGRHGSPVGMAPGAKRNGDERCFDERMESLWWNRKHTWTPRTKHKEVRQAYEGKWGVRLMKKRSFVTGKKVEKTEETQDKEIAEFALRKRPGGKRKRDSSCAVMWGRINVLVKGCETRPAKVEAATDQARNRVGRYICYLVPQSHRG